MENKGNYAFDDWVGTVRPDPRNTDPLTVLQGFLGASSEGGHIRVYSDETLNDFVEVPEDAILYSVKMTPAESSLGGSKLWLRADAVVTYGDPKFANRPKSTFLEGDIMQQYAQYNMGGQPDTTQMGGGFMSGQGDTTGPGGQFMASIPAGICGPQLITRLARVSICHICVTRLQVSCFRTICGFVTCRRTLCGPQSCIPVLCGGGGCQFSTRTINPQSLACGTGLPGGPVINPGAGGGFMGGQPDTTQMGGYYGTFNPYMY